MVSGLLQLVAFLGTAWVVCFLVEGFYRRIEEDAGSAAEPPLELSGAQLPADGDTGHVRAHPARS